MLEKIKTFFTSTFGIIAAVLTGAVGILLWFLSNKRKEINALKAQIDLAKTQKEADLIEVQIKEKMAAKEVTDTEIKELQSGLTDLEAKRKQIATDQKNKNPDEIEDFWKNH